jgi:hypothetical protein
MPLRILIIASTLIFIAGCESELERCIDANIVAQRVKILHEKIRNDQDAFHQLIHQSYLTGDPEPKISDEDQEKAERMATQFCNLQGIY